MKLPLPDKILLFCLTLTCIALFVVVIQERNEHRTQLWEKEQEVQQMREVTHQQSAIIEASRYLTVE